MPNALKFTKSTDESVKWFSEGVSSVQDKNTIQNKIVIINVVGSGLGGPHITTLKGCMALLGKHNNNTGMLGGKDITQKQ